MVSAGKLRYYDERLTVIVKQKMDEIEAKHPKVETDYQSLIAKGAGVIKSEVEIREIIANARSSCPVMVEATRLFRFDHERDLAENAAKARELAVAAEKKIIRAKEKAARDLVYLGKDVDLLTALRELEAL